MPSVIVRGLTSGLVVTQGFGGISAPPSGFVLASIISSGTLLTLTFSEALALNSDAALFSNYLVTGEFAYPEPLITGLTVIGSTLLLDITEQHEGGAYTLHIPPLGFDSVGSDPYLSTYTPPFTGVGVNPGLLMSRMVDARTLEVIYTEAVNYLDAQNSQNYAISGGIQVFSAVQMTPIIYRLTTSRMDVNTSDTYTVTVSNIHDLEGNLIT